MQRLSYDPKNPVFSIFGQEFSLEVFTMENVFGLDPDRTEVKIEGDKALVTARGLTWAGGQQKCDGGAMLLVEKTEDGLRFKVEAAHQEKLRSVKVILPGRKGEAVTSDYAQDMPIFEGGMVYEYPHWHAFMLSMPLVLLKNGGEYTYFLSKDERVTARRFGFFPRLDDPQLLDVELIYEAPATGFGEIIVTPAWETGVTTDPRSIAESYLAWAAGTYGFESYDSREDVPDWFRDVSLIVSIHGMHFSGYVFNTYKEMLNTLRWFAERMEGKRILAYLPGWEGRYYWQYGDYRPDPRLGGADGFKRLVEGAHELGVNLMPMFGANCTNSEHPDFPDYGPISRLHDASGTRFLGNKPDWSGDRAYDPGWQIWLNPGAPAWKDKLVESLSDLIDQYGFRAVFLDTTFTWTNDPYYDVFEGYRAIKNELKSAYPELLIAGERWYDALLAITPLFQMGVGFPANWLDITAKYALATPHLSAPSPCRGSVGVHEDGYHPFTMPELTPGMIPMVTIVDGTLAAAPDRLMDYIKLAEKYEAEKKK